MWAEGLQHMVGQWGSKRQGASRLQHAGINTEASFVQMPSIRPRNRPGVPLHPAYTGMFPSLLALKKSLVSSQFPWVSAFCAWREGCLWTTPLARAPSEGLGHPVLMHGHSSIFHPVSICIWPASNIKARAPVHRPLHHDLDLRAPWPSTAWLSHP